MSAFFDAWKQCMLQSGLPVPTIDTVNEAVEFLHTLQTAWEQSGADEALLMGALPASALVSFGKDAVGAVAGVVVLVYEKACISCLASVALDGLRSLASNGQLPDFVVAELRNEGIDIANA